MNAQELIEAYVDDVVRRLDRKRRNDVGVELRALLADELKAHATDSGRKADVPMAMELLRRFGRPEDVAAHYRAPGFPIIDAADAPAFVKLSAIGMALIWVVGLVATFTPRGSHRLSTWWMTFGLGAFWWPGFLVSCAGVAAWVRRRFPVADDWKPSAIDRDRISRPGWVLAIAFFMLGTIWLMAPSPFVEQFTGGRLAPAFYQSLVYDDTFRQWRLPLLLMLLTTHVALYGVLVVQGRWRRVTRRLDILLSASIGALLVWSLAAGRIFQSDASDGIMRGALALILCIVMWDIVAKLNRERMRVRLPAALA